MSSHDEAKIILFSANQNDSSFFLFCWFWAHIDWYFDSWEPAVRQNIVVYGKGAKNEANVISYLLMTGIPGLRLAYI